MEILCTVDQDVFHCQIFLTRDTDWWVLPSQQVPVCCISAPNVWLYGHVLHQASGQDHASDRSAIGAGDIPACISVNI